MITEQDLQEAIAECQGVRNPNASTCIKLAAFLTIQKEMFGQEPQMMKLPAYSYAASYESDTEFAQAVAGMSREDLMTVMDELMTTLQIVNPRLYSGTMRKLTEV